MERALIQFKVSADNVHGKRTTLTWSLHWMVHTKRELIWFKESMGWRIWMTQHNLLATANDDDMPNKIHARTKLAMNDGWRFHCMLDALTNKIKVMPWFGKWNQHRHGFQHLRGWLCHVLQRLRGRLQRRTNWVGQLYEGLQWASRRANRWVLHMM